MVLLIVSYETQSYENFCSVTLQVLEIYKFFMLKNSIFQNSNKSKKAKQRNASMKDTIKIP